MTLREERKTVHHVTANIWFVLIGAILVVWASIATGMVIEHSLSPAPTATPAAGPSSGPFQVGKPAPLGSRLVSLKGQPSTLAIGHKITVVAAIGTWCMYCAYMDKWVLPRLASKPGVQIDVVEISPQGGIADPGPLNPPFSGTDGQGGRALSLAGMESNLQKYVRTYGIARSGIHFYVAPPQVQAQWNITGLPMIAVLNSRGETAVVHPGGMTLSQLSAAVATASQQ